MSCCSNECPCTEAKKDKSCLTKIQKIGPDGCTVLPPNQWVVTDPGVKTVTVPTTTQFIAAIPLFSKDIMSKICKDGCIEVEVLSGTLKVLEKSMGAMGCQIYGKPAVKKFLIERHEIAEFSWCSPDGAVVRVEALG